MGIKIRCETINEMLGLCQQLKDNNLDIKRLEKLLDHPDYQLEFKRYREWLSKEEFIDFFINFNTSQKEYFTNKFIRSHYSNYKYLLDNLAEYKNKVKQIEAFEPEDFKREVDIALQGLPEDLEFGDDLEFVFTISIGSSFGWPYKNCSHYDVIQLFKDHTIDGFRSALAHELHHIGFLKWVNMNLVDEPTLEEQFFLNFAGEGLAVKYCNNAVGKLTTPLDKSNKNLGMDPFTWDYLLNDFESTFQHFKTHLQAIRDGKISTLEELNKIFKEYWRNPYTDKQDKWEVPKLLQTRRYSFGNDIWGVIHDVFGKEKVYHVIKNLDQFPDVYNAAVRKIGKEKYTI